MNKIFIIIFFGLIAASCHTQKNLQRSVSASPNVEQSPATTLNNDSTKTIDSSQINNSTQTTSVDSTEIYKQQLSNIIHTPINFTTFYGKAKASFSSPQGSGDATIYIHMQKDSVIWLSINGPLSIELSRVLITRDSVKILDKINKNAEITTIENLQQITRLPFSFDDFQNIIIGKPVVPNDSQIDYDFKNDSVNITATADVIRYFLSFTKNSFLLGESRMKTFSGSSTVDANIFYNDYQIVNNINFAMQRDVAVTGDMPMELQLNFKDISFNQPQTFPFTISKNYSVRYD